MSLPKQHLREQFSKSINLFELEIEESQHYKFRYYIDERNLSFYKARIDHFQLKLYQKKMVQY